MSSLIYSTYIINKAGGLIYQKESVAAQPEAEVVMKYPLGLSLKIMDDKIMVTFGEKEGIKVGHQITCINGETLVGKSMPTGVPGLDYLADEGTLFDKRLE